ncbi:MAG: TipAS antibiotic-recognition domain-containing protein, partial [Clostridia bacterium]|nr:TipAS antibiotic-recognition domain-containing protein [Clostridia bacterium]
DEAQAMVKQLQNFITANFYTCTTPILRGLADMYDGGGDFTRNIDKAGGEGTAAFVAAAIRIYCAARK